MYIIKVIRSIRVNGIKYIYGMKIDHTKVSKQQVINLIKLQHIKILKDGRLAKPEGLNSFLNSFDKSKFMKDEVVEVKKITSKPKNKSKKIKKGK